MTPRPETLQNIELRHRGFGPRSTELLSLLYGRGDVTPSVEEDLRYLQFLASLPDKLTSEQELMIIWEMYPFDVDGKDTLKMYDSVRGSLRRPYPWPNLGLKVVWAGLLLESIQPSIEYISLQEKSYLGAANDSDDQQLFSLFSLVYKQTIDELRLALEKQDKQALENIYTSLYGHKSYGGYLMRFSLFLEENLGKDPEMVHAVVLNMLNDLQQLVMQSIVLSIKDLDEEV